MSPTTILLVYGILMIAGGVMGLRAGSKVSLAAGAGSGVVLLAAWLLARTHLLAGLWVGAVVALLLSVTFAVRAAKTRKLVPAGALLGVSLAALLLLVVAIGRA